MKRGGILNSYINNAITTLGHGEFIVISDAGFPIPDESKRIDLAIIRDFPTITQILEIVMADFIYERCIVAAEQKKYNPRLFEKISKLSKRCSIEVMEHEHFIHEMPEKAKYIIRTGSFEPWGNVALCSGVDAPVWFQKQGTVVPDYYDKRVHYEEEQDES